MAARRVGQWERAIALKREWRLHGPFKSTPKGASLPPAARDRVLERALVLAGPSTAGGLPWPGAGPCLSALSSMSQQRLESPPPRPKCEPDKIPPLVKKYRAPSQSTRASSWYFTVHIISTIGSQVGLGLWWLTTRTGLVIVLFPTRAFTIRHSPFILLPIVDSLPLSSPVSPWIPSIARHPPAPRQWPTSNHPAPRARRR